MNQPKYSKRGGPGLLIAAAFIGPGTVTVCTLAGAQYQYQLLWIMVVSIFATIFLQELAARLGIITRLDLASLIRDQIGTPFLRTALVGLVFCSVVIGNAAYEAGNISGAILGLGSFGNHALLPFGIGLIAAAILWSGSYKVIERILISMVALMSLSFLTAAILTRPNLTDIAKGLIPNFDADPLLMIGLVGTTIVPYNLFLHASLARNKWTTDDLTHSKKDTIRSILIGGAVSISIIITAAASGASANITSSIDLANSLKPVYGPGAKYLLSIGLFAAGITSAVTAPLAAALVAQGCFGWTERLGTWQIRTVWGSILAIGVTCSSLGFKPIEVIKFAQVTNGLLLPIMAAILVWLGAKTTLLGARANKPVQTTIGILVTLLTLALGIKSIWVVLS